MKCLWSPAQYTAGNRIFKASPILIDMEDTYLKNLAEKTGKPAEEWIRMIQESGMDKYKAIMDHLKNDHGITHGYANYIALKARESDAASIAKESDLVDEMFKGKENLRPIYDQIMRDLKTVAADLEEAPKKAYMSLRGKKQFAILQPSTSSRLDVGINLKDVEPAGRLEKSGSFNAMVSHRVRISALEAADAELINWLKNAWDLAK